MKRILLFALLLCSLGAAAQVGINTTTPDSTALLDIRYDGKGSSVGVLLPHLTAQQRLEVKKVSDGMVVFDREEKLLYYYDGKTKKWVALNPIGVVHDDNGLGNIRPQNDKVNKLNMGLGLDEPATARLDVNGSVRVRSNIMVDSSATVEKNLRVQDTAFIQALQVDSSATLQHALTVNGNTTLQNPTTINSTLTVNGNISASSSTVTANTFVGYGITPMGGIMMWSGSTADFDAAGNGKASTKMNGWALCYGQTINGLQAPDLKGRFIVGYNPYDGDYNSTGKTGGQREVTLNLNQMPKHKHPIPVDSRQAGVDGSARGHGTWATEEVVQHNYTSLAGGNTVHAEGGCDSHENRPPYYVLAFIMRVK